MATKTRKLIPQEVLEQAAQVLKVLAHPDRMRMVELLMDDEYTVGELAELVGLAPAATSQHLNLMRAHGILDSERADRSVYYRVISPNATHMIDCLRKFGGGGR
ncbi:MAG: metalloregulator ArsR/SmtB family transcription factor [Phycisphaera sp.]|nr:metalloregulator ArsR/SmtB family transcription factor [Phycisphaera sp.]